ncbi:MAG: hypothetical protein M1826_004956 [Phylliscum demangeonii]|nr:MAG: hypothetical protein M1826_004956 [Phylliscum demangeonii]
MSGRVHDILRTKFHKPDIREFLQQLERAIAGAYPPARRIYSDSTGSTYYAASPYSAVHVLLLSWTEDDLGVAEELAVLRQVLQEDYRYSVEEYTIPSAKSHNTLQDRLREFTREYEKSDSLLIVYYGGHGYLDSSRKHIWLCNQKPSASTLHQQILEGLKHWSPYFNAEFNAEDDPMMDSHGRIVDGERRKCPVHVLLNKDPQYRSIQIAPLPAPTDQAISEDDSAYVSDESGCSKDSLASLSASQDRPGVRTDVLISVQVEAHPGLDVEQLAKWIKAIPVVAKAGRMESEGDVHLRMEKAFTGFPAPPNSYPWGSRPTNDSDVEKIAPMLDQLSFSQDKDKDNKSLPALLVSDAGSGSGSFSDNATALHVAVWRDNEAMVELLLKEGADVNAPGKDNATALHVAVRKDNEAMVKLLLKKGADVNAPGKDRRQGQWDEAEKLQVQSLEICKRVLGLTYLT